MGDTFKLNWIFCLVATLALITVCNGQCKCGNILVGIYNNEDEVNSFVGDDASDSEDSSDFDLLAVTGTTTTTTTFDVSTTDYIITTSERTTVIFSTCGPDTTFDSYLSLHDSYVDGELGTELASDDDGCDEFSDAVDLGAYLEYDFIPGVTYWLRLSASPEATPPVFGQFVLAIDCTNSDDIPEVVHNGTVECGDILDGDYQGSFA